MKALVCICGFFFGVLLTLSQTVKVTEPGKRGEALIQTFNNECALQKQCAEKIRAGEYDAVCVAHLQSDNLKQINNLLAEVGEEVPWFFLGLHNYEKQPRCDVPLTEYTAAQN
jgi:hypothetical protein